MILEIYKFQCCHIWLQNACSHVIFMLKMGKWKFFAVLLFLWIKQHNNWFCGLVSGMSKSWGHKKENYKSCNNNISPVYRHTSLHFEFWCVSWFHWHYPWHIICELVQDFQSSDTPIFHIFYSLGLWPLHSVRSYCMILWQLTVWQLIWADIFSYFLVTRPIFGTCLSCIPLDLLFCW